MFSKHMHSHVIAIINKNAVSSAGIYDDLLVWPLTSLFNLFSHRLVPLALVYDAKHKVTHLDIDEQRKKLVTAGSDRVIKVQIFTVWFIGFVVSRQLLYTVRTIVSRQLSYAVRVAFDFAYAIDHTLNSSVSLQVWDISSILAWDQMPKCAIRLT